jgi:hypothetical protein
MSDERIFIPPILYLKNRKRIIYQKLLTREQIITASEIKRTTSHMNEVTINGFSSSGATWEDSASARISPGNFRLMQGTGLPGYFS